MIGNTFLSSHEYTFCSAGCSTFCQTPARARTASEKTASRKLAIDLIRGKSVPLSQPQTVWIAGSSVPVQKSDSVWMAAGTLVASHSHSWPNSGITLSTMNVQTAICAGSQTLV
jgi:hypothetical protein